MHGAAITLARRCLASPAPPPAAIVADDMLDLSTFAALTRTRWANVPLVLYMHENQLTYPLPADPNTGPMRRQRGERDYHYVFVNLASMLTANRVLFNSAYHRNAWFAALPRYLRRFPDFREVGVVKRLEQRSAVLPVGVDMAALDAARPPARTAAQPPLILWNQRWEYDKNPEAFFAALFALADAGVPFQLALAGERFGRQPPAFTAAAKRLGDRIVHTGYLPAAQYRALLWRADITISTAVHEFFGVSIVEAIACETFPLLPHRLSYPELLPERWHDACLYADQEGLLRRLRWALAHTAERRRTATALAHAIRQFAWATVAPRYDAALDALAAA